jgi:tRNA nucleotidyltransferase (CCA-adding enzyme)
MEIEAGAEKIIEILQTHGFEAYLVGGCVRDLCLGRTPQDWDIATSALPEQIQQLFPHTIPTGLRHGTVTVVLDGHRHYEVTTYRIDGEYTDARRPVQVTFTASLEEDLRRRDFTINAMAYNHRAGLLDPFDGTGDLQRRVIRAVGRAEERFQEDALRMLRAVRLASQLGYAIERETAKRILLKSHLLEKISKERIRDELMKILTSEHPGFLGQLSSLGLMKYIIPEIEQGIGFGQRNVHHDKSVYTHTLAVIKNVPNNPVLRLAALCHDIAKPVTFSLDDKGRGHFYGHHVVGESMTREILHRLKFDQTTTHKVCILVREHMSRFERFNEKGLKKFINRVEPENLNNLFVLQIADILASKPPHDFSGILCLQTKIEKILNEKQPLTVKDLAVNGYDLRAWGMEPGIKLGQTLQYLLEKVWENPELNTREKLREEVQKCRNKGADNEGEVVVKKGKKKGEKAKRTY